MYSSIIKCLIYSQIIDILISFVIVYSVCFNVFIHHWNFYILSIHKEKIENMKIATGEKSISLQSFHVLFLKNFLTSLCPQDSQNLIFSFDNLWLKARTDIHFRSCDNVWFIKVWMRKWDSFHHMNLFLLSSSFDDYFW